jgi:acyl carrier protein
MEKLNNILCEVFRLKGNELDDKLTMEDIESWDSLTHMDLITSIEEGLNIQLTMDDIMNMKDISTIRTIVKRFV